MEKGFSCAILNAIEVRIRNRSIFIEKILAALKAKEKSEK